MAIRLPRLCSCVPYDSVRFDRSSLERLCGRGDCTGWGICRSQSTARQVRRLPLSSATILTFPGSWPKSSWTSIPSNVSASIWRYLKRLRPSSKGRDRPRIGHRLTPASSSRTYGFAILQFRLMCYVVYHLRLNQERRLE